MILEALALARLEVDGEMSELKLTLDSWQSRLDSLIERRILWPRLLLFLETCLWLIPLSSSLSPRFSLSLLPAEEEDVEADLVDVRPLSETLFDVILGVKVAMICSSVGNSELSSEKKNNSKVLKMPLILSYLKTNGTGCVRETDISLFDGDDCCHRSFWFRAFDS